MSQNGAIATGTPGNLADDKLIATYTSYLTIRPRLNSELVAGDFATVNNCPKGVGNFASAGGTFTVKWQQPLSKAAEVWPYTPIGTLVTIEN